MKNFLKSSLMTALLIIMGSAMSFAQQPFFFHKDGLIITQAGKSGKSKVTDYTRSTVVSVDGTPDNCTVSYKVMFMDAKKKPLLNEEMDMKVFIKDGAVTFDINSFVGKVADGMTVTGDNLILPANTKVGDTLKDFAITVSIAGMKTTSSYSGVKAVAEETLTISGNAIECIVVECNISAKVLGFKQEMKQKTWYGRGIGPVKTETYNKKGKLQTSQEVIEIEGW